MSDVDLLIHCSRCKRLPTADWDDHDDWELNEDWTYTCPGCATPDDLTVKAQDLRGAAERTRRLAEENYAKVIEKAERLEQNADEADRRAEGVGGDPLVDGC